MPGGTCGGGVGGLAGRHRCMPGANRSRQAPQFEYGARCVGAVVAPTVSAPGVPAGEALQASAGCPPRRVGDPVGDRVGDGVVEAGLARPEAHVGDGGRRRVGGDPVDPGDHAGGRARAGAVQHPHRDQATSLATPYVAPPMVPATWVPCPLQSSRRAAVDGVEAVGRPATEVGVGEADAGVDDVHLHPGRAGRRGRPGRGAAAGLVDPVQTPRRVGWVTTTSTVSSMSSM